MTYRYFIDLRLTPVGTAFHAHVYSVLRTLDVDAQIRIWTPEDPILLIKQLQHQMRNNLVCTVAPQGLGWLLDIHIRNDIEPLPLVGTLLRDHEHLDKKLIHVLSILAQGTWSDAVSQMREIDRSLRSHIEVENNILAPLTPSHAAEAVALMRHEHDDLVNQLNIAKEVYQSIGEQREELKLWLSLIAATLNKHEHREESLLFNEWERAIQRHPDKKNILHEVREQIEGHAGVQH